MMIRRAIPTDIERINDLLFQVSRVHCDGRPDIFKKDSKKYTDEELISIISDDSTPVFVATDDKGYVLGYAFCIYREVKDSNLLHDMKTLYIDDLCVDEDMRGRHIGKELYEYVLKEAKKSGCYRITLNVWQLNAPAMRFYEKCGLSPLKTEMEQIL